MTPLAITLGSISGMIVSCHNPAVEGARVDFRETKNGARGLLATRTAPLPGNRHRDFCDALVFNEKIRPHIEIDDLSIHVREQALLVGIDRADIDFGRFKQDDVFGIPTASPKSKNLIFMAPPNGLAI
jgi:hypothetical protein